MERVAPVAAERDPGRELNPPATRGVTRDARRAARAQIVDPAAVMDAAAAFLAVRPRSVAETRRRLRHLGYREALVEQVVTHLVEMGYLDDAAFARAWLESRDRARPRGEAALRRELTLKGVAHDVVADALEERDALAERDHVSASRPADLAAAGRLLERKATALSREPDQRKRHAKAYALLARNGFDPEICREVAARLG